MFLIDSSVTILTPNSVIASNAETIERAGRTCYKSETAIGRKPLTDFIRMLIKNGHTSVLEHSILSVKFVCDRAVANELVRHRHCAFSQESTRYCNYSSDKFGGQITFIKPWWWDDTKKQSLYSGATEIKTYYDSTDHQIFYETCANAENAYMSMIHAGYSPQIARAVLPLCTKTEIVVSASYREWREIFRLRLAKDAHPDMQQIMRKCLYETKKRVPVVFEDIDWDGLNEKS